ncbi:MAG: hypothetical protein HXY25_11535 [Alphaproteobacteria bacterium]|nr:hypothetical protein [Alphaproteobacteria bacterium]
MDSRHKTGGLVRRIAALGLLVLVAGCGFRPMYGSISGDALEEELAGIAVAPIEGRLGFEVRESLLAAISPRGEPSAPDYRLEVKLRETEEGLLIERDASITRFNYSLIGSYVLREAGTGEVVYADESRSIGAFNVVDSQFATLVAREDVQERTARDLARDIVLTLALYFEGREGEAAPASSAAPAPAQ